MKKLLMIIPLVILLCFTSSCQDKEAMAELEEIKDQAAVEAKNKDIIEHLIQVFNEGNLEVLDEIVAPEFVGHNPLLPEDIQGPEGLKGFFSVVRTAMPDVLHPSWTLIAEGDLIAVHMPMEGTFENELMGIPPNGNKVSVWMANICKVADGKVVEWWVNMDTLGLMQQLGMELKPKEEK